MDFIKTLFPFSFKTDSVKSLLITIVAYIVIGFVVGLLLGLLGKIWLVGWIFRLIAWIVRVYMLLGILFALLSFFKVIK